MVTKSAPKKKIILLLRLCEKVVTVQYMYAAFCIHGVYFMNIETVQLQYHASFDILQHLKANWLEATLENMKTSLNCTNPYLNFPHYPNPPFLPKMKAVTPHYRFIYLL